MEVRGGDLNRGEYAFDLGNMPDMVPGLAVLATRRFGRTLIRNVGHLRFKESDRLKALATELSASRNIGPGNRRRAGG